MSGKVTLGLAPSPPAAEATPSPEYMTFDLPLSRAARGVGDKLASSKSVGLLAVLPESVEKASIEQGAGWLENSALGVSRDEELAHTPPGVSGRASVAIARDRSGLHQATPNSYDNEASVNGLGRLNSDGGGGGGGGDGPQLGEGLSDWRARALSGQREVFALAQKPATQKAEPAQAVAAVTLTPANATTLALRQETTVSHRFGLTLGLVLVAGLAVLAFAVFLSADWLMPHTKSDGSAQASAQGQASKDKGAQP